MNQNEGGDFMVRLTITSWEDLEKYLDRIKKKKLLQKTIMLTAIDMDDKDAEMLFSQEVVEERTSEKVKEEVEENAEKKVEEKLEGEKTEEVEQKAEETSSKETTNTFLAMKPKERVLEYFDQRKNQVIEKKQLWKAISLKNEAQLTNILVALQREEKIEKAGYGKYKMPEKEALKEADQDVTQQTKLKDLYTCKKYHDII